MSITISALYRYPVKGLSAERLTRTTLVEGRAVAQDRRFAIAHAAARLDPANLGAWRPKAQFLQLSMHAKLATLSTRFDDDSGVLTVERSGRQVAKGSLLDPTGRAILEQFFSAYLAEESRGKARIVEADDQPFSDTRVPFVSFINTGSASDLERVVGRPVSPMRFRGNVVIEGAAPWSELNWVGKMIRIGAAVLRVDERTGRCAATNVDPETGQQDLTVPRDLLRAFRHSDCGIYATVITGGDIAEGDTVEIED